jgi:hypothetical protein
MARLFFCLLFLALAVAVEPPFLLSAPWTPFHANSSINLEVIPDQVSVLVGRKKSFC